MTDTPAAPRAEPVLDHATRADTSAEMATTALWRAAIGPLQTDYYLRHFSHYDALDRTLPRWNTAAALSTLNWMLLRRMGSAALAYSGLVLTLLLAVFGIGKLVFHYPPEVEWALAALLALLWVVVPGLWGNVWLYKHLRHEMGLAVSTQATLEQAQAVLLARAPTRQRLIGLGAVSATLVTAVASSVLWFSQWEGTPTGTLARSGSETAVQVVSAAVPAPSGSDIGTGAAPLSSATPPAEAPVPTSAQGSATTGDVPPPAPAPATAAVTDAPPVPGADAPKPVPISSSPSAPSAPAAAPAPTIAVADATPTPAAAPAPLAKALRPGHARPYSAPPAPPPSAAATPTPGTPSTVERKAPAPTQPAANTVAKSPHAAAPQPSSPAAANSASRPYGINVGLFANPDNARRATAVLLDAGILATNQPIKTSKGAVLHRVRSAPYESEQAAQEAAVRIRALGLEAQVYR